MALRAEGIATRVVSLPCVERFLEQDPDYQEAVLPNAVRKRIAIEAGATGYWYRFVGMDGVVIGLDRYGESAPASDIYTSLGITADRVKAEGLRLIHSLALI